jgi:hypothetical protein
MKDTEEESNLLCLYIIKHWNRRTVSVVRADFESQIFKIHSQEFRLLYLNVCCAILIVGPSIL